MVYVTLAQQSEETDWHGLLKNTLSVWPIFITSESGPLVRVELRAIVSVTVLGQLTLTFTVEEVMMIAPFSLEMTWKEYVSITLRLRSTYSLPVPVSKAG